MELLTRINREQGITVLVSLHQVQFAQRFCTRTIALRTGEVVYDGPSAALDAELLRRLYGSAVNEMLDGTGAEPRLPAALQAAAAA
jgi:phosphonate transport system ATP-binding protein